jgi:NAD(P) transhydrogenase subunit beta
MTATFPNVAYVVASFLFILSLRGLSQPSSSRRGNLLGGIGMLLAIAVTLAALWGPGGGALGLPSAGSAALLGGAIAIGCVIGAWLSARVAMTQMPELVAILHSFVGAAAVLVGIVTQMTGAGGGDVGGAAHRLEIGIGVLVGAVTFSGSVVAFLKLRGTIGGKPLLLPGRNAANLAMAAAAAVLVGVQVASASPATSMACLLAATAIALLLGVHLVAAIGGGDMPVVVSMLNSYSGWAAAAAGFMLGNDLLIITGALVGASGAILSTIMCVAMNRSIVAVIFGGFGSEAPAAAAAPGSGGAVHEGTVSEVAELLTAAKRVVVVPGYGMAVAQAQHAVREITDVLAARGVSVRYAIHPVAGRLPGHMNVLLAEAGVSYEIVKEMDEVNDEFPEIDVALVIGANDIVNPAALDDPASPIYGMPVLQVWKAGRVVMMKRSLAAGYAGIDNPLCYRDNTVMLFGDAKQTVMKLLALVQGT